MGIKYLFEIKIDELEKTVEALKSDIKRLEDRVKKLEKENSNLYLTQGMNEKYIQELRRRLGM